MANTISEIISGLSNDRWRNDVGFSEDIQAAHDELFNANATDSEVGEIIGRWLQRFQPCLFGRIAAKLDLITFCILNEADLSGSDEEIHQKIQNSRLEWTKAGFDGRKSAFVVIAVSQKIAAAEPNEVLRELAARLCTLYLQQEVELDTSHLDQLFLQIPDSSKRTWRYYCGVNFFASAGDKRWWNDHRIPGGVAFSVNSVGHLVRSGQIANNLKSIKDEFGVSIDDDWIGSKVDSLEDALTMAMRTISLASETVSGKATRLLELEGVATRPNCPVALPTPLSDKDHCEYRGYYHTDHTIPSTYFDPAVERPEDQDEFILDFTYLFKKDLDNPDHFTMGVGKQIRADERKSKTRVSYVRDRGLKGDEQVVSIEAYEERIRNA